MKLRFATMIFIGISAFARAAPDFTGPPEYRFVSEYVRHIIAIRDLQLRAAAELEKSADLMTKQATAIRSSTRMKLELNQTIGAMNAIKLSPPVDRAPSMFTQFYAQQIEMHDALIELATQFMAGPKPGVNYGKLAAQAPKITASLEYIDESLYKATPMLCLMLYDAKAVDAKGNINGFLISSNEKRQLLDRLTLAFGKELDSKNQSYLVGSRGATPRLLAQEV